MLEQAKLGFETEKDFINAVQMVLKKEASERSQLDRTILRAFAYDYNNVIQYIAGRWNFSSEDAKEELPQQIWTEVCARIGKWEYERSKFTTWLFSVGSSAAAEWWRKQNMIRLPYRVYQQVKAYPQAQEALRNRLERNPVDNELADELKWSVEEVREVASIRERIAVISLDQPIGNDENDEEITLGDSVPTPSPVDIEDKLIIRECIERLGEIHRVPFVLFHVEGCKQKEVASMLGICPRTANSRISRARRIFGQCLKKKGIISA